VTREERRERIRQQVDGWPPFTPQQRARLAVLLRPESQPIANATPQHGAIEAKAA
jgi:hypothetical protein